MVAALAVLPFLLRGSLWVMPEADVVAARKPISTDRKRPEPVRIRTSERARWRRVDTAGRPFEYRLDRGRAELDVDPLSAGTQLKVWTPHAEVVVVGTRFSVEVRSEGTEVRVIEGVVRVRDRVRPGAPRVLRAGDRGFVAARPDGPEAPPRDQRDAEDEAPAATPTRAELLRRADRLRHAGAAAEARALYARALGQSRGGPREEEIYFRLAQTSQTLDDTEVAIEHLETARTKFPNGLLALERSAMHALLLLEASRPHEAAALLLSVRPFEQSRALDEARVRVATAMLASDRELALRLLDAVIDQEPASELAPQARALLEQKSQSSALKEATDRP